MIKVAVIDDGIKLGSYGITQLSHNIIIKPNLLCEEIVNCNLYKNSHGTICAGIIKKYYPDAIFSSVKILNDKSHKCNTKQLVKAIEWCLENNIQVVNISLGTINYRDFDILNNIINKAYSEGLIIVAAYNNLDIFTCPASYSNVIGVKSCSSGYLKEGKYIFNLYPIDGIEITSCSEHKLFEDISTTKITNCCNSYAAPMITAKVCEILSEYQYITFEKVKQKLYEGSINYSKNIRYIVNYRTIDWIRNAALIQNNDKYHNFELPYLNVIKEFNNINDINFNKFDTLILLKSSEEINKLTYKLKNKNIIILDDTYKFTYNNICRLWSPSIIKHFFKSSLPQKKIDIPLILVYGYSDCEILKSVQSLTINFRNDGYYAGGIYTDPISILYGLEYLPMNRDENMEHLKNKIEMLYKVFNYDVIICGVNLNKIYSTSFKEVNLSLKPDIQIFIINDFLININSSTKRIINSNYSMLIMTEESINKHSFFKFQILKYEDSNSFYEKILNICT